MSIPTEVTKPTQKFTIEEIFGENSQLATQVLDAQELAIMQAASLGEIRRITRMAQTKLRELRRISFSRDRM